MRRLLHGGGGEPGDPSWAPDGKHLCVSAAGATIYERDIG